MGVFFFGMGYSSLATAKAMHDTIAADLPIAGTTRTEEGVERLAESPYRLHVFDGLSKGPTLGTDLRQASHVVLSIPPNDSGDPAYNLHRDDIDAAEHLEWLCYYSTVGVYGDFGGQWIDETAPTRPINKRSQQRVEVEQLWRDYAAARNLPLLVLRLAGIYGPGRSSFDKLREGTARRIIKKDQVFNRIRVEDIGASARFLSEHGLGGIYNVTDDQPGPPQDVIVEAARLMGVEPPPEQAFETAEMTPMARSFYGENKRVSNAKLKAAGFRFAFPNYPMSLAQLWQNGRWKG